MGGLAGVATWAPRRERPAPETGPRARGRGEGRVRGGPGSPPAVAPRWVWVLRGLRQGGPAEGTVAASGFLRAGAAAGGVGGVGRDGD